MAKKTIEQELLECRENIISEIKHWEDTNENGCNDPFWPDGMNMNLVRNHVLHYKRKISEICAENNMVLPSEYYLPTPPCVDNSYMATLKQENRVKRIIQSGGKISTNRVIYKKEQLSFV